MQKCPKCESQYDGDLKICRRCGAILEPVDPPHATQDAASGRPSWTCRQCGQRVPAGFEVCWSCGTSDDGTPDPAFSKEIAVDAAVLPAPTAPVPRPRLCPRCGSSKIVPNARLVDRHEQLSGGLQVVVEGDPTAMIFKDRLYARVTADICGECGHLELKAENAGDLYKHFRQSSR